MPGRSLRLSTQLTTKASSATSPPPKGKAKAKVTTSSASTTSTSGLPAGGDDPPPALGAGAGYISRQEFSTFEKSISDSFQSLNGAIAALTKAVSAPSSSTRSSHDPEHEDSSTSDADSSPPPTPPPKRRKQDTDRAARQLSRDLAGEHPPPAVVTHRPLGDTLDGKIKAKIWAGRFINLPSLIPKFYNEDTLYNLASNTTNLAFKRRVSHFLPFNDWCGAFDTYISVMAANPPSTDTIQLMIKHKSDVIYFHTSFPESDAWHTFDIEFRKAVAAPDVPVSWGSYDPALFGSSIFKAMVGMLHKDRKLPAPSSVTVPRHQNNQYRRQVKDSITDKDTAISVPKGHCLGFHAGKKCRANPCRFKHDCPSCTKPHRLVNCTSASNHQSASITNKSA